MNGTIVQMDILRVVEKTLKGFPRMTRARTVRELAADDPKQDQPRRFLIRRADKALRIRVAEQLDLEVEAIVRDGELGSLGLIHLVPTVDGLEDWLRERVGKAAYLRHLLLDQVRPGTANAGKIAYAIELVLVVPGPPASAGNGTPDPAIAAQCVEQLGDVLRQIIREAGYLHALGINVWRTPHGGGLDDAAAVRRAFAWLLKDTEAWYGDPAGKAQKPSDFGQVTVVELKNFRLAGPRRWRFVPGHRLHLVHGHNGSGKSSFCEALELVVTGKIERLAEVDYAKVLTNRAAQHAGEIATVVLESGKDRRQWTVESQGVTLPLQPGLPGSSFRMDQSLADRLSQADPAARARLFLEAFFPGERDELRQRDEAWNRITGVFDRLPKRVRSAYADDAGQPEPNKIKASLAWVTNPSVPWENVKALLPVSPDELTPLAPLLSAEFVQVYEHTGEVPASYIASAAPILQKELSSLGADLEKTLQSLNQAVAVLEEYGREAVASLPPETEELGPLMNRWLESLALADILEKEDQLLAAISTAKANGYAFSAATEPLLARLTEPPSGTHRQEILQRVKANRDALRRSIMQYGTRTAREASTARPLKPLSEFRLESLDAAAALGVFGDAYRSTSPRFDQAVRQAFTERQVVEVRSGEARPLRVGESGWGSELLARAVRIRDALQGLASRQNDLQELDGSLDTLWPHLIQLYTAVAALSDIDAKLLETFTQQVGDGGPLSRAVNEVMALLTPARWAYEDIVTRAEFASGKSSLELQTPDDVPLRLRFNTAELNTFAITLFLLCARRIDSQLRTIVLDDPLQNMDELTVVTVARGLGHLLRLWQRFDTGESAWRLAIFLHSEEDIECFRAEIPCVTYLLPWLSPQDSPTDPVKETKVVASLVTSVLQPLDAVLGETPR
jgi:AAA domain